MNYSHRMASQFPVFLCEVHRTFPCPNVQQLLMLHHLSHCAPSKQFIPFCSYLFVLVESLLLMDNSHSLGVQDMIWVCLEMGYTFQWPLKNCNTVTDNPANLASLFRAFFRASKSISPPRHPVVQSAPHQPLQVKNTFLTLSPRAKPIRSVRTADGPLAIDLMWSPLDGCELLHHQPDGWNMLKPYKKLDKPPIKQLIYSWILLK